MNQNEYTATHSHTLPGNLLALLLNRTWPAIRAGIAADSLLSWSIEEDQTCFVARDRDSGSVVTRLHARNAWPPGGESFAPLSQMTLTLESLEAQPPPVKEAAQRDATAISRRLALLETHFGRLIDTLFPRHRGRVDWESSPFAQPHPSARPMSVLVLFELSCECRCRFCSWANQVLPGNPPALSYAEQLYRLARELGTPADLTGLVIGGPNASHHQDLADIIALARLRGYDPISLETASVSRLDPPYLSMLHQSGLAALDLPLYGATPETHDAITGVQGHFKAILGTLDTLPATGLKRRIHSLALRENAHELPALIAFIAGQYPDAMPDFQVLLPFDEGPVSVALAELMPRLSELAPEVRHHIRCLQIPCRRIGGDSMSTFFKLNADAGVRNVTALHGTEFSPRCDTCRLKPRCSGVPKGYLAAYGDAEFTPVT